MPTKAEDSVRKDVLYPDELQGKSLIARGEDGVLAFWDAEDDDDAEELPEDARYGWFLPVSDVYDDWTGWASMPRSLRMELLKADVKPGDGFHVKRLQQDEDAEEETAEYTAEVEKVEI